MNLNKFKQNSVWLCLLIIVLVLPYSITGTSIAIILFIVCWIVEGKWNEKKNLFWQNHLLYLFISLFLIQVIGILYSDNYHRAYSELQKKLAILIFPVILGTCSKIEVGKVQMIMKAFAYNCFLIVLICLGNASLKAYFFDPNSRSVNWDLINIQEFQKSNLDYSHRWDSFSYMEFSQILKLHPTYFSLYLLTAILILIYLLLNSNSNKTEKRFFQVLIIVFSIILFLLAARVILVTTIILSFYFFYKMYKNKYALGKPLVIFILFIALAGLLIYSIPYTRFRLAEQLNLSNFKFPDNHDQWNSTNLRLAMWYCSLQVYSESPFWGVGTGDFQDKLQVCYQSLDLGPFYKIYNSHNQYLQVAVTNGIVGLFILLTCILWPFFKTKNWLYSGFLFIFAMTCLTESVLQTQKGIVFYSLFNSLMAFHLIMLDPVKIETRKFR